MMDLGLRIAECDTEAALSMMKEYAGELGPEEHLVFRVPDLDAAIAIYRSGQTGAEDLLLASGKYKSLWNRPKIEHALDSCSLYPLRIETVEGITTVTAKRYELKPVQVPMKGVRAIMSLPRVAWTDTQSNLHIACSRLGIDAQRSTGVFWGQCLERMIEGCVADGVEYILTVDYDSIFDENDIVRLWQVMEANPEVSVLCPVQIQRDHARALASMVGPDGRLKTHLDQNDLMTDALDIHTGHFGLTLIRVSALEGVERPLFLAKPDPNGGWNEGRTDEDIHFWHRLRSAGRRVCLCPRVRIGHLQLVITWPDEAFNAVHQYHGDYTKVGRPVDSAPR